MALTQAWTGRAACALQAALRESNEAFAKRLGVALRTVGAWHQRPEMTPRAEMQQALDTVFEQVSDSVRSRFYAIAYGTDSGVSSAESSASYAFTVAVSIVINETHVLLVQRRGDDGGGISWQFPAGVVKPGVSPEVVAVRETLAETGVHCRVLRELGRRVHPITSVYCAYLLCDYLGGDVDNKDIVENVSVTWVPRPNLTRFIPAENVFPPILQALENDDE